MAMTEDERAERQAVIDVLVPVEIPKPRSVRAFHRKRVRREVLHIGRDAARHEPLCADVVVL
jgi:hypothetical protein